MLKPYERTIFLESAKLSRGITCYSLHCPVCGKSGSFSVSVVDVGILYNCFRNSCGIRGFIPYDPTNYVKPTVHVKKEYKEYELTDLPDKYIEFFYSHFEIDKEDLEFWGVKYSPEQRRVIFPILDELGREIGRTARGYKEVEEYVGGKSLHYKYSDVVPFAYYSPNCLIRNTLIIVEDSVSVIKIFRVVRDRDIGVIGLLGTNLSSDLVKLISNKHVLMWLDQDALKKAIDYKQTYGIFFKSYNIIYTEKDPKDLPYIDIEGHLIGT